MLAYTLIEKKQQGKALTKDEIRFLVKGFLKKEIPAYQMSAFLMAVYFKGMDADEISAYIDVILHSGKRVRFTDKSAYYVDKHSTGGVGDKISLILAPLAMASGRVRVPMISGRGLGHSGGTLDKLESIPGFRTDLSLLEFRKQTDAIGCALIGQTADLCPADKELYALRDVTATVRSIPLICGSILSKKIAEGIQGLVLDVKTGNGAFIPEYAESRELASKLKYFGEAYGLSVRPVLTDMNQPLGEKIGNWLEVEESLDVLKGGGPADVRELSLVLTTQMLSLADPGSAAEQIRQDLETILDKGAAFEAFLRIAKTQGADIRYLENPERYRPAKHIMQVKAGREGTIAAIDTYQLGLDAIALGAGRTAMTDKIDPRAGLIVHKHLGDAVRKGELLVTLHSAKMKAIESLAAVIGQRFTVSGEFTSKPPIVYEIL
ncbi:MAG: thymidine phosphorylase [Candidatus Neomarinimicrobiota bacterium]|jgi:pyrimidine-nucleoside phosphorylase|nr:thymidine phosphorylase [Candidatus Neomarinimicrobiota bacterium]MDX9779918.1 thymidine phosphorylase [bacterium]